MDVIGRELFASELPDARCEYGPLGVFGPEKSVQFFNAMTEAFTQGQGCCTPGLLELHQITTPVIQVAGDLKTAKGMWMSTGAILMLHDEASETGRSFTWDSGKYAVDFVRKESYSEDAVLTVFQGLEIPERLREYGWSCKSVLYTTDDAVRVAEECGVQIISVTGTKGVIGAVAAIGCFDIGERAAGIPEDFE